MSAHAASLAMRLADAGDDAVGRGEPRDRRVGVDAAVEDVVVLDEPVVLVRPSRRPCASGSR